MQNATKGTLVLYHQEVEFGLMLSVHAELRGTVNREQANECKV